MFAVFGEILFEVLDSPSGFDSSRSWEYAEQPVVEDRPKLQWIANALELLEVDFSFHASFTNPSAQLNALTVAADDHNARALVFGNGVHRGYFVVTAIRTMSSQMSADGSLIAITMRVSLKEWSFASEISSSTTPTAPFPLIGMVPALPGASTGFIANANAGGLGAVFSSPAINYLPPSIASPGVSPLLNVPGTAGVPTLHLMVGDVAPSVIVRAAR